MSKGQFLSLVEWDWCEFQNGNRLHGIRDFAGDDDFVPVGGMGVTACGRRGRLSIPGFFTRMGAQRCVHCCRALGYPLGIGSPKNDDACRDLAEKRAARWEAS